MSSFSFSLFALSFSISLWLGFYLLTKRAEDKRFLFTALGLLAYSLSLGLAAFAPETTNPSLIRLKEAFIFLPSLFWTATLIQLLLEGSSLKMHLYRFWLYSALPLNAILLSLAFFGVELGSSLRLGLLALLNLAPLLLVFLAILGQARKHSPSQPLVFVFVTTLFFALAVAALFLPSGLFPKNGLILGLGFDLLLLGLSIAYYDAFDLGESLLPDMLRSLLSHSLISALFVGQIVLFMVMFGQNTALRLMVFSSLSLSALLQAFASPLQSYLDRLIFAQQPKRQRELSNMRAASDALRRSQTETDFSAMSKETFSHLTRKALSQFADLSRLGSSPLTQLPSITQRLDQKGLNADTLNRTQELKQVLLEAILGLKPQSDLDFSPQDEWRHYNVLYFPYILGAKPFNQRSDHAHLDSTAREALEYFRTYVPERTFYNWQKVAASVVAQHIREANAKVFV